MSENNRNKAPKGRPNQKQGAGNFGRPAGENRQKGRYQGGRPAAGQGERRYGKPAFDKNAPQGERRPFGRPATKPEGGERRYGKPAFDKGAPQGERRPFGRPAAKPEGGERRYGKPAFDRNAPQGERRPFSKPFARPEGQEGAARFAKPSFVPDTHEQEQTGGRPRFSKQGFSQQRSYSSSARPTGPRPSFHRAGPGRTDFRSRDEGTGLSADARKSAMLVLNRVLLDSGYAALSLDEHFDKVRLSQKDKRLCTRIVYLTLEHLNQLDFALDRFLEDPEKIEKRVRNILRLSAAQILLMDRVPESAAVNEAVKLTRDIGLEDLTGLVNGVLRNLIRGRQEIVWPQKDEGLSYYRLMHSLPEWYAKTILEAYGQEEGEKLLSFEKQDHYISIRPNLQRVSEEKFEELIHKKVWEARPGILPGVWHVSGASDIARDNDFIDGLFSIQGEGSMVAAMAVKPKLGAQVLDACAAPGGKSAYIAEQMQGTGRVQAWDLHEHRVDLIQALADRLRLYNIRPAMRDALVYREQLDRMMDAVLIDAPCTGTGMLFEKPDLRHHLSEESYEELSGIQARLLDTCSRYVKPGGTLVYSTCSILPGENEEQVRSFLETHPDFAMDALPEEIPEQLRALSGAWGLQLLPHRDGMEGFFIARMRRA